MERDVIRSDLKKQEIQPQLLLDKYLALLEKDIKILFPKRSLQYATCPVTDEQEVRGSFRKLGMQYQISQSLGNIYLSLQPDMNDLKLFYLWSSARKFWLSELWPQTQRIREKKIMMCILQREILG